MQDEGWFKIGRLHVTTTVGVVLLGALGMLAAVIVSGLPSALWYAPDFLLMAQVWRVFTWPLADMLATLAGQPVDLQAAREHVWRLLGG